MGVAAAQGTLAAPGFGLASGVDAGLPPGFAWHMPVAVRFGAGCAEMLPGELGGRRVLVLGFTPATALGWRARWQAQLGGQLLEWIEVDDGLSSLARCRELSSRVWPLLAREPGAVLLALGGGTTLDVAKVLRCRPLDGCFDGVERALRGQAAWPALERAPLWMVPTTAGTGSEVTRWATVWDTRAQPPVKRSFDEPFGWAERAYVDAALTLSCPLAVTRDTALDALSHALESVWNRHANPVSDALALSAARRVLRALPAALQSPDDLALRTELALAALEAGLAFSQTRTALAHALSYAVTLEQGLPHGLAVALWLPTAWELAVGHDARVDALLAQVFTPDAATLDNAAAVSAQAARGALMLRAWLQCLGVELDPARLGITDAAQRVRAALGSVRGRNFVGAGVTVAAD
jgi:phosphonate metabolism-associated iron-containing alcohol dehydrogenase